MSTAAARGSARRSLRRFVRTPKGYLLVLFAALLAVACTPWAHGGWLNLEVAVAGAVAAAAVDLVLVAVRRDEWIFPSGALLSGLIVAMVLSAHEPLPIVIATAGIASASKHIFRMRAWNVFNPAALAVVVSSLAFGTGQSWWGALPDLGPGGAGGIAVVAVAGLLIANHINKLPLVLSFLAAYFVLFTAASYTVGAGNVVEIFRTPDTNMALFFAVFMLDDPPTCPARYTDQIVYGVVVAAAAYAFFMEMGVVYYLLAGLLVGNAWESFRRGLALLARPARSAGA